MGFPVVYTEVYVPNLLINAVSILGFIRRMIHSDSESTVHSFPPLPDNYNSPSSAAPPSASVSASLIMEILPAAVKFSDLALDVVGPGSESPERCAVCLSDFEGGDEIQQLSNCRHIFHRCCLDRWLECDRRNCPLCRTPFVPDELLDSFNERLWAAAAVADYATPAAASHVTDFYGEFIPLQNFS